MNTSTQIRVRRALGIAILATLTVAASVSAGKVEQTSMDVSAIMTNIDVGSLPVQNITDAY